MFETLDSGIFTALVLTGGLGWFSMRSGSAAGCSRGAGRDSAVRRA